ncbi:MAG: hypothetical protein WCG04_02340 [Alphaproteobacteria bacterium]
MVKNRVPTSPYLLKVLKEKVLILETSVTRMCIVISDMKRTVLSLEEDIEFFTQGDGIDES